MQIAYKQPKFTCQADTIAGSSLTPSVAVPHISQISRFPSSQSYEQIYSYIRRTTQTNY